MSQRKRVLHVSSGNAVASNKNGVEVSQRKSIANDNKHWDFLDEIEASMWVDLTLECQSTYHDEDDDWFDISHPFHQCSSRQLISVFSHSAEGSANFDLDVLEQSSPKLPPSVSRSRGKEYRSKNWGQGNQRFTLNHRPPVKSSSEKSSYGIQSKRMTKNKRTNGRLIELSGSKSDSIGENGLTENAGQHNFNLVAPSGDQKCFSNSNSSKEGQSSFTSTVTSEVSEQQQKSLDVSSRVLGQTTNGFLSALKVSLRKSCVTRQASRVEVTNSRQSEGQKSSSSKSSAGSSSNFGYSWTNGTSRDKKDITPDSRNARRNSVDSSDKVKEANLPKAPVLQTRDVTSNFKSRSQSFGFPSIKKETANLKVEKRKVLVPRDANKRCTNNVGVKVKEKTVANRFGQISCGGKENPAGKGALSQKSSARDTLLVQTVTGRRVQEKSSRKELLGQKERIKARIQGKKAGTIAEKVYF